MKYPKEYDLIKVNGTIPDWVDDYDNAYFGSPDDFFVVDMTCPLVVVKFYNLTEIPATEQ